MPTVTSPSSGQGTHRRSLVVLAVVLGSVAAVVVAYLLYLRSPSGQRLGQREFVVTFDPAATPAMHDAVRAACPGGGKIVLEPKPTSQALSARVYDVRYRVDTADDAEINQLAACVRAQPGVVGYDIPTNEG